MEEDIYPEPYENDLEEHELNELAKDREAEDLGVEEEYPDDEEDEDFADPGGRSALRAATPTNPRNRPCPTCRTPDVLTLKDVALGYQCDSCADALEGGGY